MALAPAGHGKLRFSIVSFSAEDEEHPARELLFHNPQTRGWQCPRFATFPQELTLQLERTSRLSQIQLLSHEYKIATKVEIFIGVMPEGETDPLRVPLRRLGYLSFDANEAGGWQARELKTVPIGEAATVIRLVLHRAHPNKLNIYNQVGLYAVNVVGDGAAGGGGGQAGRLGAPFAGLALGPGDPSGGGAMAGPTALLRRRAQEAADVLLDFNVDSTTADIIRQLHARKEAAVAAEKYDDAKRLKDAVDRLKVVGVRLAQMEADKGAAIEIEDYEAAKLIKADIDRIRAGVYPAAMGDLPGGATSVGVSQSMSAGMPAGITTLADGVGVGAMAAAVAPVAIARPTPPTAPAGFTFAPPEAEMEGSVSARGPLRGAALFDDLPVGRGSSGGSGPLSGGGGIPPVGDALRPPPTPDRFKDHPPPPAAPPAPPPPMVTAPLPRPISAVLPPRQPTPPSEVDGDDGYMEDEETGEEADGAGKHGPGATTAAVAPPAAGRGRVRHSPGSGATREWPPAPPPDAEGAAGGDVPAAEPLTETLLQTHTWLVERVGAPVVAQLLSRAWQNREAGLRSLATTATAGAWSSEAKAALREVGPHAARGVTDSVSAVQAAALELLRALVAPGGPGPIAGARAVDAALGEAYPLVVDKAASEAHARVREAALEAVEALATSTEVGAVGLSPHLCRPVKSQAATRLVAGRLALLSALLPRFGLAPAVRGRERQSESGLAAGGIPLEPLMAFVGAALGSASADVRAAALSLALAAAVLGGGAAIAEHLPKDLKPSAREALDAELARRAPPVAAAAKGGKGGPGVPPAKGAAKATAKSPPRAGSKSPPRGAGGKKAADAGPAAAPGEDCQFCGRRDAAFSSAEALDLHFFHDCPMLVTCRECGQVVEVASYTEHLLTECDARAGYKECRRCREAVKAAEYAAHIKKADCPAAKAGEATNRCPCCHKDIGAGDAGWRKHLAGGTGCAKHNRKPK